MELLGKTIAGRYQIRRPLGENAYSAAFKAYDDREARPIILKFLRPQYANDLDLIKRLRPLAARHNQLVHFNIVSCYGFEQSRDHAFWVLDFIEGLDLAKAIQQQWGACAWEDVVHIAEAIGAALQYAHTQSLYHGNVAPANILLQVDGSVLLTDFGIAASVQTALDGALVTGTPAYMPPELLAGASPDARTDIYALAAVLYELVTGQVPFSGDQAPASIASDERALWEKMNIIPAPLASHGVSIPPLAEVMLMRAMSKEPAQRPVTIASFVAGLSGRELALQYPPMRSIAALAAGSDNKGNAQGSPNMRQAAARLVAFLSDDASLAAQAEPVELDGPHASSVNQSPVVMEAQPKDEEAPVAQPQFSISWEQIEQKRQQVEEWMQAAGAEALEGHWDRVIQICRQVFELDPDNAGACVLTAEARAHVAKNATSSPEGAPTAPQKGD